jgi:hypothetical protein
VTSRLLAAVTGWGKSYTAQVLAENNLPEFPVAVVFDFKDEYRGLVEHGLARHFIVGPKEAEWSAKRWSAFLQQNPKVVLARYQLTAEEWQEVVGKVVRVARHLGQEAGGAFLLLDEAHHIAPQRGSYPQDVKGLATTGRGEGAVSLWVTQRLSELDETPIAQATERMVGGFSSDADLDKIGRVVDYPQEVHNPGVDHVHGLPEELHVDGKPIPVRQFKEDGKTVGSEWVYSDLAGNRERRDTREWTMESTHHGPEGNTIKDPE